MAINRNLNPWGKVGSNLDIQRQDLWLLDLTTVISALGNVQVGGSASWGPAFAPFQKLIPTAAQETVWWTYSVDLPMQGVQSELIKVDTSSAFFPGNDLPGGEVKLKCYVDTCTIGGSKVIATLMAWDTLRSVGNYDSNRPLPLLPSAVSKPQWWFDLTLLTLRGATDQSLNPSGAYYLSKCWLQSWQVDEYRQTSKGDYQSVSVTLQTAALWPIDPLSIGYTLSGVTDASAPASITTGNLTTKF